MSWLGIIALVVGIYLLIGLLFFSVSAWDEWRRGNDITWGDLLYGPLFCTLWLWPLIEWTIGKVQDFIKAREGDQPYLERVAIKGRLSAKVERALRE